MDNKVQNICSCITRQLKLDRFSAEGSVSCTFGDSIKNQLDGVTIKLSLDNHFETEIKIFKNDLDEILIQYKTFNGVIELIEMIGLSNSLNNIKQDLKKYFN